MSCWCTSEKQDFWLIHVQLLVRDRSVSKTFSEGVRIFFAIASFAVRGAQGRRIGGVAFALLRKNGGNYTIRFLLAARQVPFLALRLQKCPRAILWTLKKKKVCSSGTLFRGRAYLISTPAFFLSLLFLSPENLKWCECSMLYYSHVTGDIFW